MRPSFVAASEDTQTPPYPLSHLLYTYTNALSLSRTLHSSRFKPTTAVNIPPPRLHDALA